MVPPPRSILGMAIARLNFFIKWTPSCPATIYGNNKYHYPKSVTSLTITLNPKPKTSSHVACSLKSGCDKLKKRLRELAPSRATIIWLRRAPQRPKTNYIVVTFATCLQSSLFLIDSGVYSILMTVVVNVSFFHHSERILWTFVF